MKIGMAARAAGVSPSTIRYYEAVGIIDCAPRVSGTRSYQPEIIDELKALRYLRANGLSIRSLASIAKLPRGSAARRDIWVTVMQAQIADIKERIREARLAEVNRQAGARPTRRPPPGRPRPERPQPPAAASQRAGEGDGA